MAVSSISIPVLGEGMVAPSDWLGNYGKKFIPIQIAEGYQKWKNYFDRYAKTSRIPTAVLVAFAYIESGMKASAVSPTTVNIGLYQWNYQRGYADKIVEQEAKLGRLTQVEIDDFKSIGKRRNFTFDETTGKFSRAFTPDDAKDPQLSILIGSIWLSQLADSIVYGVKEKPWAIDGNTTRWDKIIVVYNQGAGGRDGKIARNITPIKPDTIPNFLKNMKVGESKKYVVKLLGKGGTLDIIKNEINANKNTVVDAKTGRKKYDGIEISLETT